MKPRDILAISISVAFIDDGKPSDSRLYKKYVHFFHVNVARCQPIGGNVKSKLFESINATR